MGGPISNASARIECLLEALDKSPKNNQIIKELKKIKKQLATYHLRSKWLGQYYDLVTSGLQLEIIATDIMALIDKIQQEKQKKSVENIINVDPVLLEKTFFIDSYHLYQVLKILYQNALTYTRQGQILLKAKVFADSNRLHFTIADTGIGIPERVVNDINHLPAFFKEQELSYLNPALKLTYAQTLIRLLGGNLTIQSELEKGTCVEIIIPFYSEERRIEKRLNKNKGEKKTLESFRYITELNEILLVEDDSETAEILQSLLQRLNSKAELVKTGQEAVVALSEHRYDLILLDISLPDMDGLAVKRQAMQTINHNSLFVGITSTTTPADIEYFLDNGLIGVLAKPITFKQLKKCLEDAKDVGNRR